MIEFDRSWSTVPMTKEELVKRLNFDYVYWYASKYHKVINIFQWLSEKRNMLIPIKLRKKLLYEP